VSRASIGVVIATPGRRSLLRTLNSIEYQGLQPGDDVLVVGDGYHEPTAGLVELMGPPFRYVATEKTRDWGHSQQNYGLQHVGGDWLVLQDDDDVFLPRAFDEIRDIVGKLESPRPVIGRVMTPYLGILWTAPGVEPLDGHCLVVPNDKAKLGYFGSEYEGDQKWLATNLEAYDTYTWADRIWTLTRPTGKLWPSRWYGDENTAGWFFHRDVNGVRSEEYATGLRMARHDDVWKGSIHVEGGVTLDEAKEVMQFAAWAGQGCDVWIKFYRAPRIWIEAAIATGYRPHEDMEYVFEWPPHKFEPPKKEVS